MFLTQENVLLSLQNNPIFREFPDEQLSILLKDSALKTFNKRTCFISSNLISHYFYVIIEGRMKVYFYDESKDRKITLFILTKHDVFNVYNLFDYTSYNVFYETLDDVTVIQTPINRFKKWMDDNPRFSSGILHYLISKMKALETYVTASCLDCTSTKLARLLLKNAEINSSLIDGLPHKEIAQYMGTTRAVLNRHLQKFKNNGIIEIHNKTIRIVNLELLKKHI
ncbi:CRP/FNR family transcriptional regulator, anaerobic regulatory protein [Hyunsoonleella jejuensis]|uniref:CRP/FNR family transcriptional regulator, anaerobic regulatory protein n=1 Tax=Hyunsoonleella jejuensis TaxID=419940 RepID=A0A1H9KAM1_9FLAO|nr:Crp/Fnr family transcriptional regulator [Hyunsoonleella jejuensis]SEQ95977.1 CRP/FNR family transcriptional regulator, anaerobic regulatory protein [Hyunsoonleella jejuensis]